MTQLIPPMSVVDEIGWSDSKEITPTSLKVRDLPSLQIVFKKANICYKYSRATLRRRVASP